MILYRADYRPLKRSKFFALPTLVDLFIPTPTRLPKESLSLAEYCAMTIHMSTAVYSRVVIYTAQ